MTSGSRQLAQRREEFRAQGLEIQAGELTRIGERIAKVKHELRKHEATERRYAEALRARRPLLKELGRIRERRFYERKAALERITRRANAFIPDLNISVYFKRQFVVDEWADWLRERLNFRSPRIERLGRAVGPRDFARIVWDNDRDALEKINYSGESFFGDEDNVRDALQLGDERDVLLELQLMDREDLPVVEVRRGSDRKEFDRLSAGQQRSVLLSLVLAGDSSDPLIVDQPEDHLDASFVAGVIVSHLEDIKERRQVIMATHNANLAVLGDAELIVPMYGLDDRGKYLFRWVSGGWCRVLDRGVTLV